jgi:hypothetical protein
MGTAEPVAQQYDIAGTTKRRGRKPKIASVYDAQETVTASTAIDDVIAAVSSNMSDDENVIVHLNVTEDTRGLTTTCIDDEMAEDEQPYAYNSHAYTSLQRIESDAAVSNVGDVIATNATNPHAEYDEKTAHAGGTDCAASSKLKIVYLLKDFEEKNKNKEWPLNTSVACYWCCHRFDTPPFGTPIEYVKPVVSAANTAVNELAAVDDEIDHNKQPEHFRVCGCFCSLECAAAHNFNSTENHDEIWERYNLINMLARKIGYKAVVKPAPNRLTLKMFGGYMEIDQFRAFCDTGKLVHINFPPMISITQQIEEVNEYDINSELRYIPVDNERVSRYKEKITFRRPKTNKQEKSILEHAMNMKFIGGTSS